MKDNKQTPSQIMSAMGGPVPEINGLQEDLAAILADVLQRRQMVTKMFGSNDEEAEKQIQIICRSFSAANRKMIGQRLLNAYNYERYPVTTTIIPQNAPETTTKILNRK